MGYEQKMILIRPYMEKPQTVIHLDNFQLSKNRVINGGFAVYHYIYMDDKGRTKKKVAPYFYLADGNTKVYLSKVAPHISADNIFDAITCGTIAMIDLCKTGDINLPKSEIKVAYFADDGNTKICKDKYDAYLYQYEPQDVLAALKEANKAYVTKGCPRGYRRLAMAIDLLEGAIPDFGNDLKVTFFGH